MGETLPYHPIPTGETERRDNQAQLLRTHLSADFRNEFVALWNAAQHGDRAMLLDLLKVIPQGRVRRYAERFVSDGAIQAAMSEADPGRLARLDTLVDQLNTLLAHPEVAELSAIAAVCAELNSTLSGESDSSAEAQAVPTT